MSDQLKDLQEQIATLGKRRNELNSQLDKIASDLQQAIENLGEKMLDNGSSKDIETLKREIANADGIRSAVTIAIAEADKRIAIAAAKELAIRKEIAENEILGLGADLLGGVSEAMRRIYAIYDELPELTKTYRTVKELCGSYGITAANFLPPLEAESLEVFKFILGLSLETRVEGFKRRFSSMDADLQKKIIST